MDISKVQDGLKATRYIDIVDLVRVFHALL